MKTQHDLKTEEGVEDFLSEQSAQATNIDDTFTETGDTILHSHTERELMTDPAGWLVACVLLTCLLVTLGWVMVHVRADRRADANRMPVYVTEPRDVNALIPSGGLDAQDNYRTLRLDEAGNVHLSVFDKIELRRQIEADVIKAIQKDRDRNEAISQPQFGRDSQVTSPVSNLFECAHYQFGTTPFKDLNGRIIPACK